MNKKILTVLMLCAAVTVSGCALPGKKAEKAAVTAAPTATAAPTPTASPAPTATPTPVPLKSIGEKEAGAYEVQLKNATGKAIKAFSVKLQENAEFPESLLKEEDIFTDGEESCSEGITSQGAFAIAGLFKKLSINDDVFVFDCMGTGDVPVLCENNIPKKAGNSFIKKMAVLEDKARKIIRTAGNGKWFCLPCNYSDNASFIAQGIPAVAITVLPSNEVSDVLKNQTPKTWKNLHTQNDSVENLWENSFSLSMKIFDLLAQQKDIEK